VSFAYLAQAVDPRYARFSYCVDATGNVCLHPAARPLDVSAGACPKGCGSF
jgi:hypothetical protein